jgi:predicted ATP-dependent protease
MGRKNRFEKEVAKLCRRFGMIAVKKGYVTPEQVKEAFNEQLEDDLNGREHRLLGTILFEKKLMTWDQVDEVLMELFKENIK